MIKKTLLWLWITLLSFIWFSNAQSLWNLPLSFYQWNTYNTIDTDLNFESILTNDDTYKSLYFSFSDGTKKYIFWNNWKIYFYNWKTNVQWYYDKVCLIQSDDWTWNWNNCQNNDYQDISIFYNLQTPNFTNARVYPEWWIWNLCFYDSNSKYYYCFNVELLTWSLNIPSNTNIDNVSQYFWNSFFSNWTWNKPIQTGTNNNYICPTIWQLMRNMGEKYNTWLCYNNTMYFNWTNFEQIEKEDIFTIYDDDYNNYINRISIYRNNCTNTNTTQACKNAFSGEYKKYSIISNAINSNVDEKKLRNYCNMWLNYDSNATTCVASWWWIKENYTTEEMINDIINGDFKILRPWTWTVFDNLREYEENKCNTRDARCNINQIYEKITWLFENRNGQNWIIPDIILWFWFIIILFTVIFKW